MKIRVLSIATALSSILLASSALGGTWVDRYWPLNGGDHQTLIYDISKELTLYVSDQGGDQFEVSENSPDVSQSLFLWKNQDGLFLTSVSAMGVDVSLDPPVLLLNDNILQNGGTVKTSTTVTQPGLDPYPATFTVTVAKAATVAVPAGSYADCRSIKATEVARIPDYGTITASALTAYLAPNVGIIKTLVKTPSDFAQLVSGTIGGADVRCLAKGTLPQLTISIPKANQRFSNAVATVEGTAGKNASITQLFYRLNTDDWQLAPTANGWSNWSALVNLSAGSNTFSVYAIDACNRPSATQSVNFTYVVSDRLVVQTNGQGGVAPAYGGQLLEIGKRYNLTATPAAGYLFSGWTGGSITTTQKLSFVMQSNLVLQANFVPNPFIPVKGNYQGLFSSGTNASHQNSGFLTATITEKGSFSGKLQVLGSKVYPLAGKLLLDGSWSGHIAPAGLPPLTVLLQLDFANGDSLQGHITAEAWTADLLAYRAVFSSSTDPAPQTGKYAVVIPGDEDSTNAPGGESIGTLTVDASGNVKFVGSLADGVKLTQAATISRHGSWPLFATGAQLMLHGWMNFPEATNDDVHGILDWSKAEQSSAKYYPAGFILHAEAVGSAYVQPPVGSRLINLSTGQVWLANGNLQQSFTNLVTLGTNNKVTNLSSNKLSLIPNAANGSFLGSVTVPGTIKTLPLKGVFLQNENSGYGFFLGTNQSGRVRFGPAVPN